MHVKYYGIVSSFNAVSPTSKTYSSNKYTFGQGCGRQRSKVKVTGSQTVKALLLLYIRREDIRTIMLNSHDVLAWLFLYTPCR